MEKEFMVKYDQPYELNWFTDDLHRMRGQLKFMHALSSIIYICIRSHKNALKEAKPVAND